MTSKVAMRFGEVILKTAQYDALKSWYCRVLAWIIHERHRMARISAENLAFCRVAGTNPVSDDDSISTTKSYPAYHRASANLSRR